LATSLDNFSIRLAESGEGVAGLEAIRRAVEIGEKLAGDNFAVYGPHLTKSLKNLSVHLTRLGKVEEAKEIRTQLETIKRRILDEQIQPCASLAPLFE
jgi:hypothetical protein